MVESTKDVIVKEVAVEAPRERVFRALTEAAELQRWFPSRAESDPRTGGRFHYSWEFPRAPERDHIQSGAYRAIEPGARIAYPWKVGETSTEVEFVLDEVPGGTRVRMEHSGWTPDNEGAREEHEQGWDMFLGNLKSVLEGGEDIRASAAGMLVG